MEDMGVSVIHIIERGLLVIKVDVDLSTKEEKAEGAERGVIPQCIIIPLLVFQFTSTGCRMHQLF